MSFITENLKEKLAGVIANMDFAVNACVGTAHTHDSYEYARKRYSDYISFAAGRRATKLGFGWAAREFGAPNSYEALMSEFGVCLTHLVPFTVWDGASDKTVFTSPQINHAFRFIHDTDHCLLQQGLTHDGEVAVITPFIYEVYHAAGFVAAILCACDLLGQLWYGTNNHGAFVDDQAAFVKQLYGYIMYNHGAQEG